MDVYTYRDSTMAEYKKSCGHKRWIVEGPGVSDNILWSIEDEFVMEQAVRAMNVAYRAGVAASTSVSAPSNDVAAS